LNRFQKYLIWIVVLGAVCATFVRLFFGVDLTDESQYIAQALGPLIGGTAFVTDRLFQQSGSLWVSPFFWIFLKLTGSTTGLVLYFRILYFAACLTTAGVLFQSFRKKNSVEHSLALAVLPILYIPFAIPSISYNTMGVLMSILSFSLWRLLKASESKLTGFFLSLSLAMGVFSYPPVGLAYFLFFILEFQNPNYRKLMVKVFAGSMVLLAVFSISVFSIGMEEIEKNFAIARAVSLLTLETKWNLSLYYLKALFPGPLYWILIPIIGLFLGFRKKPFELIAVPVFVIFFISFAPYLDMEINSGFLLYGVALTFLLKALQKVFFQEKWNLRTEILVSLLIGLLMGSTSGNGITNAALGFSIAIIYLFESALIRNQKFPLMAWLSVVLIYCYGPWAFFYRESRLPELSYQIQSGPFYGLITNSFKYSFLSELEADLKTLPSTSKSIFVYDSLPAGYLFTSLQPVTFLYYMHPVDLTPSLRPELIRMFVNSNARPDVVVETMMIPLTAQTGFIVRSQEQNLNGDPFWGFFRNSPDYRLFLQRAHYAIYVRNFL
jgi:hypothetical protein